MSIKWVNASKNNEIYRAADTFKEDFKIPFSLEKCSDFQVGMSRERKGTGEKRGNYIVMHISEFHI